MKKFNGKYRIESARCKNWDYSSAGYYFITICTKNRIRYLGDIRNKKTQLSYSGQIVKQCWFEIPKHFSNIVLDEFIVMPDHIHGIIKINGAYDDALRYESFVVPMINGSTTVVDDVEHGGPDGGDYDDGVVEMLHATSLQCVPPQKSNKKNISVEMASISPKSNSLSNVIRSFKSAVTKNIRQFNPKFGWQNRFHDRIIRDKTALKQIRKYIVDNPKKWNDWGIYNQGR